MVVVICVIPGVDVIGIARVAIAVVSHVVRVVVRSIVSTMAVSMGVMS